MARDQKIYETNNYGGGVLVDRTTELPVGFTAQGVDQYMVIPVADPLTGGIGLTAAGVQIGGDASPHAFTTRALTAADNGMVLTCATSQTATVNSGLAAGFGVAVKGTISFTAGSGVTITDLRSTGSSSPWCALTQTATDAYDLLGNKA